MTSLTDQFLNRMRGDAQPKSESPTPLTTSQMPNGDSSNVASSDEPIPRKTHVGWGESVGIVLGVVAGTVLSILLGAFGIHWILGLIKLGGLTYWQIVGLLAIWEMVKPTAHSK